VSAEPELVHGIEADVNVPSIGITPSLVAQPASVLVAARTRILGDALADVLIRTGYEVHLMRPGCSPGSVVLKARTIRPALVLLELPARWASPATAGTIAELHADRVRVVVFGSGTSLRSCTTAIPVDGWASSSDSLSSLVDTVRRSIPVGASHSPRDLDPEPAAVLSVAEPGGSAHKSRFDFLTSREQQVLTALMDGTTAVEIARQFFMSPSTVRHHIRSILLKLNVNSQLAAVVAAYQAGWPPEGGTTPKVNARVRDASPPGRSTPSLHAKPGHSPFQGRARGSAGPEQIQSLSG
jgi:two-component system nitrate/nitrite response regulator NarL